MSLKFAAVGATSLVVNAPLGVWREHCKKFSPEWFVAVHASIPLIMSLRKALLMPTFAVLVTITAAVTGQFVGSRLERARCLRISGERDAAASLLGADGAQRGAVSRRRGRRAALPAGPRPLGLRLN